MQDEAGIKEGAHRRAVVRRPKAWLGVLYACQIRKTSTPCALGSQIAVPEGGPAMRGGLRPWFRAGGHPPRAQSSHPPRKKGPTGMRAL